MAEKRRRDKLLALFIALYGGLLYGRAVSGAGPAGAVISEWASAVVGALVLGVLYLTAWLLAGDKPIWSLGTLSSSVVISLFALPLGRRFGPGLLGPLLTEAWPDGVPAARFEAAAMWLAWGALLLGALILIARQAPAILRRPASHRWRWVFGGLLAVYGGLAVYTARAQSLTGDEPHYLLAAESLRRDGDLDLTDDYREQRYRAWFPSDLLRAGAPGAAALDPHDVPGLAGERRPIHQIGLSLLLLPGVALAGRAGALAMAVILAAATGAAIWRLNEQLLPPETTGLGTLAVVLFSPLLAFSASLHAEPAAALCLTWLALLAVAGSPTRAMLAGGALAALVLPWLHVKFIPVGLLLAVFIAADGVRARRWAAVAPLAALLLGTVGQLAMFAVVYGSPRPDAPQLRSAGKFPGAFSGNLLVGLPGLVFDQQDGLFVVWPLGLLALVGLRTGTGKPGRRLLAAIGLHLLLIATYRIWQSGFAPAGRQLVPILGLLAPFVGAGAGWLRRSPRGLVALAGLNAGLVLLSAWVPRLRYPLLGADGLARSPLAARVGEAADWVLPLVGRGSGPLIIAWVYLVVAVVLCWGWVGRTRRSDR